VTRECDCNSVEIVDFAAKLSEDYGDVTRVDVLPRCEDAYSWPEMRSVRREQGFGGWLMSEW
jgi:hypothetical protein